MLLKNFYIEVISSEVACVNFLQDNLLLGNADAHEPCVKCSSEMVQKRRKNRNPMTGARTQSIERSWLDAKIKILKKMRDVPMTMFQSHLDHY